MKWLQCKPLTIWNYSKSLPHAYCSQVFKAAILCYRAITTIISVSNGEHIQVLNNTDLQIAKCIALLIPVVRQGRENGIWGSLQRTFSKFLVQLNRHAYSPCMSHLYNQRYLTIDYDGDFCFILLWEKRVLSSLILMRFLPELLSATPPVFRWDTFSNIMQCPHCNISCNKNVQTSKSLD